MSRLLGATALLVIGHTIVNPPLSNGLPPGSITAALTESGAVVRVDSSVPGDTRSAGARLARGGGVARAAPARVHRTSLGCGATTGPDVAVDLTSCTMALVACSSSGGVLLYHWTRLATGVGAWSYSGQSCGTKSVLSAAQAPPAGPTPAMLLTAFRRLPFATATVTVDPPGGVTLVNLETYFRATWAQEQGLAPGQTSEPVVLLGQAVQFRIATVTYRFDFGDGTHIDSGSDPGATYPAGRVRHTYTHPQVALVRVEVVVTGQFRLGAGPWSDLPGTAALTRFPATRLVVREAHGRLVSR